MYEHTFWVIKEVVVRSRLERPEVEGAFLEQGLDPSETETLQVRVVHLRTKEIDLPPAEAEQAHVKTLAHFIDGATSTREQELEMLEHVEALQRGYNWASEHGWVDEHETEADDGHEPGSLLCDVHCPGCGVHINVVYGTDPKQVVAYTEDE